MSQRAINGFQLHVIHLYFQNEGYRLKILFNNSLSKDSSFFFLFCIFLSMYLYPGSTYINHDTTKYLFNENFLSDLGRTITHGGQNNFHSSFLFNLALVFGGITYIIFFSFTHKIFNSNTLSKIGSLLRFRRCIIHDWGSINTF